MRFFKISIFILCFYLFAIPVYGKSLELHFIDVGEGDAIFIQTPQGQTALIDVGNLITGYKVVQYLKKKKIDHLILTHPDQDHIGGIFFVMQMLQVGHVYDNNQPLDTLARLSDFYRWYLYLVRQNPNYQALQAGNEIQLSPQIKLKVLWPSQPLLFNDFNPNSLVLMLEYDPFKALLAGDLITTAENKLLETSSHLKADLLKLGHHGSLDTSSEAFIDAVKPNIAIISANHGEYRDYPSEQTLERLRKREIPFYRTDQNGTIVVHVNKKGEFKITKEK